jgi:hypothetical protein
VIARHSSGERRLHTTACGSSLATAVKRRAVKCVVTAETSTHKLFCPIIRE